jgi:hypothetical protein
MKTIKIKTIALLMAMGIISMDAIAQKNNVQAPQAVQTAFQNQYPLAALKNWKMKNNQYVATFKLSKRLWKADYTMDGTWVSSERNIRHMASLPYSVRTSLKHGKYASYYVDNMESMQMPAKNMYVLKVDNNGGNKSAYENAGSVDDETLYFSARGRLVKTESNNN